MEAGTRQMHATAFTSVGLPRIQLGPKEQNGGDGKGKAHCTNETTVGTEVQEEGTRQEPSKAIGNTSITNHSTTQRQQVPDTTTSTTVTWDDNARQEAQVRQSTSMSTTLDTGIKRGTFKGIL